MSYRFAEMSFRVIVSSGRCFDSGNSVRCYCWIDDANDIVDLNVVVRPTNHLIHSEMVDSDDELLKRGKVYWRLLDISFFGMTLLGKKEDRSTMKIGERSNSWPRLVMAWMRERERRTTEEPAIVHRICLIEQCPSSDIRWRWIRWILINVPRDILHFRTIARTKWIQRHLSGGIDQFVFKIWNA